MPQFQPKRSKTQIFAVCGIFHAVCVQFLKMFVAKEIQNTQKRPR